MNLNTVPSHVAILVPSVRKATQYLQQFDFQIGQEEVWDGEGTREIYVEREKGNSLLLMEPIKPGAYQRAMEKRGPGLHHLAIDVLDLESYLQSISVSGWLLHPISIKTMKQTQTAYLAKPGFPALIEVQERKEISARPLFVTEISLPIEESSANLISYIGLEGIVRSSFGAASLSLAGNNVQLKDLF